MYLSFPPPPAPPLACVRAESREIVLCAHESNSGQIYYVLSSSATLRCRLACCFASAVVFHVTKRCIEICNNLTVEFCAAHGLCCPISLKIASLPPQRLYRPCFSLIFALVNWMHRRIRHCSRRQRHNHLVQTHHHHLHFPLTRHRRARCARPPLHRRYSLRSLTQGDRRLRRAASLPLTHIAGLAAPTLSRLAFFAAFALTCSLRSPPPPPSLLAALALTW